MPDISDTLKHDLTERLWTHVQDEVKDILNIEFLEDDLDYNDYPDRLHSLLEYLETNLSIYIK